MVIRLLCLINRLENILYVFQLFLKGGERFDVQHKFSYEQGVFGQVRTDGHQLAFFFRDVLLIGLDLHKTETVMKIVIRDIEICILLRRRGF